MLAAIPQALAQPGILLSELLQSCQDTMLCYSGLAITKRAECCSATCSVLHASGAALLSSGLIADIIGGVGHLLTSMQVRIPPTAQHPHQQ